MEKDILGLLDEGVEVERDAGLMQWEHDRIIVTRVTFKRMLAIGGKDFAGMWALYGFYFNKAREDKTDKPWALDVYCMKGLGWGRDKFYRYKKLLLEHKFIEQIIRKDDKGRYRKGAKGKAGAFFIKVNSMNKTTSVQSPGNPYSGETPRVEKPDTSALTIEREVLKRDNDNVTQKIVSLFSFFKIPEKDRVLWFGKYSDDKAYLLKQLQYAAKQDSINNPVRWIQSALDGDFASSDSEEIEQRERQAVIDKGRENHEAQGIDREVNNMIPGDTEGGRYASKQDTMKTLNGFLMKYKAYPDITSKCREILKFLQEGGAGELAINRMMKEVGPLMQAIEGNRQPVEV